MRLIKRETKRRAVLTVIVGLLLLAGIFCAFFLTAVTMKRLYGNKLADAEVRILALEKEKKSVTQHVFKAAEEIKAGEAITEEKVVETEVVSEMERTLYMTKESMGKVSRIDIKQGTFITESMLYHKDEVCPAGEIGYRNIRLQGNISEGDYIDVRIYYPNGEDMKVLAEKRVEGIENSSVIYLRLTEKEMLMMASAVNDMTCMRAELYTVKCCIDKKGGAVNYLPSEQVLELIIEYADETFLEQRQNYIEKRRLLESRVSGGE